MFRDWSRGSYIQNILMGVSEQCPDNNHNFLNMLNDAVYTVDDGPVIGGANPRFNEPPSQNTADLRDAEGIAKSLNYATNGNLPLIVLAVLISSLGGFLVISVLELIIYY